MSSAVREIRYQRRPVIDGNLAGELDWAVRRRELEHAGEAPRHKTAEKKNVKVKSLPKVEVREAQPLPIASFLGAAAFIGLMLMVLLSCVELTQLSSETVKLKSRLAALETDNIHLTSKYEQMFDLSAVKEAAEAAGMTKPGSSQISYVDLSAGDSAVVYRQEEPSALSALLSSFHHGVYAVMEYLD